MQKVRDLTPKLSGLVPAEKELTLPIGQSVMGDRIGGLSMYANSFKRGAGTKVFGTDENGMWLGGAEFDGAPFRVSMAGNMYAQSADGGMTWDNENNRILIKVAGVDQILIGEF